MGQVKLYGYQTSVIIEDLLLTPPNEIDKWWGNDLKNEFNMISPESIWSLDDNIDNNIDNIIENDIIDNEIIENNLPNLPNIQNIQDIIQPNLLIIDNIDDKLIQLDNTKDESLCIKEMTLTKPKRQKKPIKYHPIAQQFFNDKVMLKKLTSNLKKGLYKCCHCQCKFKSLFDHVFHMDQYQIIRPFKCQIIDCPYKHIGFTRRAELTRHIKTQHSTTLINKNKLQNFHYCNYEFCDKKFPRLDSLKRHEKLCHLNEFSRFNIRLKLNDEAKLKNSNNGILLL